MVYHVLTALIALSVLSLVGFPVFVALGLYRARHIVRFNAPARPRGDARELPGVSILKPVAGADDDLEASLETFFALDYPTYEIVFGVRSATDAAVAVIDRVRARHPERASRVVCCSDQRHASPKVSNLAGAAACAQHRVLWLSDSSTRVHPGTLASMVRALDRPGVGCVASPVVGDGEATLGSALENVHMTTFVGLGSFVAHACAGVVGTGKSVVVPASTIDAVGGWSELGRFSGEDIVLFQRVRALGQSIALDPHVVCEVSRRARVRKFLDRHLRWTQIRWRTVPLAAALEPLLSPMVPACVLFAFAPAWRTLGVFALAMFEQTALDLFTIVRFRGTAPGLRCTLAVWLRPAFNLWLWIRAATQPRIAWRGHAFRIGRGSEIVPDRARAA